MAWAKLDDKGCFHPKVIAAGNAAYGAWTRALQHCSGAAGDGLVTRSVQKLIDPKTKIWDRLVAVGLMDRVDDESGDLLIHDFLEYNPSSGNSEERRALRREAGRLGGIKSGASRRSKTEASCFEFASSKAEANSKQTRSMPTNPVPSRPKEEEAAEAFASPEPPAGVGSETAAAAGSADDQILASLRAHGQLEPIANREFARVLLGRAMGSGRPIAWVCAAIDDAVADMPPGLNREAIQRKVRAYCDHAKAPRHVERPSDHEPELPKLRVRTDLPGIPVDTKPECYLDFDWDGAAFGQFRIPASALEATEKRAAELGQLPAGYYDRKARLTPKAAQQSPSLPEPDTQDGAV